MSKIAVVLSAVVALSFVLASAAFADEGPHGSYGTSNLTSSTDKCAGCHRAHTAIGDNLLVATSTTALCESCHGAGGAGADTDVWDGKFVQGNPKSPDSGYTTANGAGQALNGGGFLSSWNFNTDGNGTAGFLKTTSRHGVAGLEGNGILTPEGPTNSATAWGGGTSKGLTDDLECTSCHNPHGSQNYRILNAGNGHGALNVWTTGAAMFATNNVPSLEVKPSGVSGASAHDYTAGQHVAYDRGITDFCASCHTEYVKTVSNTPLGEVYDAGDGQGAVNRFRHPVSNKAGWNPALPGPVDSTGKPVVDQNGTVITGNWDTSLGSLATNSWIKPAGVDTTNKALRRVGTDITATSTAQFNDGQNVTCLTCHFAHGSSAAATNQAANVAPTNDSALLYLNNRGVCQDCHGKTD